MLNTPPHLEARDPRGFVSIFHGTSSSVARRRLRASDLSFWQSMPSFDIGRPGLHLQSGASVVLGGVGELPGSRCTDFNPRTPCGARPDRRPCRPDDGGISIHAPRVGRDNTSPIQLVQTNISIHAPRVGCDAGMRVLRGRGRISIHAPRVGRDVNAGKMPILLGDFNPRAPCGARRAESHTKKPASNFNPRAPCGARPRLGQGLGINTYDFNPRAPCGARPLYLMKQTLEL